MNKIPEQDIALFVSLYDSGKTIAQISSITGFSRGGVYEKLKDCGTQFRSKGSFGYKHTEEAKARIGAASKKRTCSADQRAKISAALMCHFNGLNGYGNVKKQNRGYVLCYAPDHPKAHSDGYVMLHTVIAERMIGRYLASNEVVHHINRIRNDNTPQNLIVMDKRAHMKLHMEERSTERNMKKCNGFS